MQSNHVTNISQIHSIIVKIGFQNPTDQEDPLFCLYKLGAKAKSSKTLYWKAIVKCVSQSINTSTLSPHDPDLFTWHMAGNNNNNNTIPAELQTVVQHSQSRLVLVQMFIKDYLLSLPSKEVFVCFKVVPNQFWVLFLMLSNSSPSKVQKTRS